MRTIKHNEKIGVLLILISALGYGLMPIFSVKPLELGTEVSTLLFMRFFLASIVLWLYIFINKIEYKTSLKTLVYILLICFVGFTVASVSVYNAYKYISGTLATLILFTHPFIVMFLERIIKKSKITKKKIMAFTVTMLGLFLVLYDKSAHFNIKGILLAFLSAFAYSVFCIGISERNTQKLNGIAITAYMATVTALSTAIQCYVSDVPFISMDNTTLISAVLLAVFSTLMASITFYEGLSIVGPSSATLISSVEPAYVVLLSTLFLKEVFKINFIIGGLTIILGIIILELKKTT